MGLTEEILDEGIENYEQSNNFSEKEKCALYYSELMALNPEKIDPEILCRACSIYIGEHDFASFAANRKDGKQINTVRTINSVDVAETPHGLSITFSGNGFLYKMVRLLVGAAVRVAEQREELSWLEALLNSPGTSKCQYCATGEGLYLVEVVY